MPADELTNEDRALAENLVASGRFANVSEAVHAGLEALHEEEDWQEYARDRIEAGLADLEAGRTIDGKVFIDWLLSQRQKQA